MKRAGILGLNALLLFVLFFVVACSQAATPTPTATAVPTATAAPSPTASLFPLSITDSNGKTVTLQKPPERIVAIDSAAVEILFALGDGQRIAGTHNYVTYPPETKNIPKVGDAFSLNLEEIAVLKPDLIYTFYDSSVPELEKLGVPVLYLSSPSTFNEVADRMRLWGEIVNKPGAGDGLAKSFLDSVKAVTDKVAGVQQGPSVYYDLATGWWTSGSGTLEDEIFTMLKAKNVFGDISGSKQVSPEQIVARDPQVIITVDSQGLDRIKSDPALQNLSAVKDGRVFYIDPDLLSVPGPRLVQGVQAVAKALYPNLFQ